MTRIPVKLSPTGFSTSTSQHQRKPIIRDVIIGVATTVIFVISALLFIRLAKKRKGILNTSASRTAEAAIQPFTTDSPTDVPDPESQVSQFASGMLSETAPRNQKGLLDFLRREPAFPNSQSPQISVPIDINNSHSGKQRINWGARASTSSALHATEPSATVTPLHMDGESTQEVRNSDPDLRRELDHLRRELERMRQVQEIAQEAPPLYEDERPGRLYV